MLFESIFIKITKNNQRSINKVLSGEYYNHFEHFLLHVDSIDDMLSKLHVTNDQQDYKCGLFQNNTKLTFEYAQNKKYDSFSVRKTQRITVNSQCT